MNITRRSALLGASAAFFTGCSPGDEFEIGDVTRGIVRPRSPGPTVTLTKAATLPEIKGRRRRVHGSTVVEVVTMFETSVVSWDLTTGKKVLERGKEHVGREVQSRGSFGRSRPMVLLQGRSGNRATAIAMDARTGKTVWTSVLQLPYTAEIRDVVGDDEHVAFTVGDDAIAMARDGLPALGEESPTAMALSARDGSELWANAAGTVVFMRHGVVGVDEASEGSNTGADLTHFRLLDAQTGRWIEPKGGVDPGGELTVLGGSEDYLLTFTDGGHYRAAFDARGRRWVKCPRHVNVVGTDGNGRMMFAGVDPAGGLVTWTEGEAMASMVDVPDFAPLLGSFLDMAVRGGMLWWASRDDGIRAVFDRSGRQITTLPRGLMRWWSDDVVSFGRTYYRVEIAPA